LMRASTARRVSAWPVNAPVFAPDEEAAGGAGVGLAGVRVPDLGGEEVDEAAPAALAGAVDDRGELQAEGEGDGGDEPGVHPAPLNIKLPVEPQGLRPLGFAGGPKRTYGYSFSRRHLGARTPGGEPGP
jgi:hypothetical protein